MKTYLEEGLMDNVVEHADTFVEHIRGVDLAIDIVVGASARAVVKQVERLLCHGSE